MILATTHDSATGPASQESGGHDSLDWAGRLALSFPFSPNAYFQEAFFVMVLSFPVWRHYLSVLIQVMFNPPLETGGNTLFTFICSLWDVRSKTNRNCGNGHLHVLHHTNRKCFVCVGFIYWGQEATGVTGKERGKQESLLVYLYMTSTSARSWDFGNGTGKRMAF
ncbi:hypothetical protein BGZ61DRAFT_219522 [Ilyonectria robusta]|uniref:uncharacterized protein n=1 Tax=Ilyonectria robusta TaxID=1079257 RepID=UPI001E8E2470|nr:uncharacterized protein BGZ61DRAFT_219522 [Ilyonectria robusta]KAH8706334.1 hypothetical protein BGZ61DRAFT_219522 [Ilyonectria robusta]